MAIPGLALAEVALKAIERGMAIYDYHLKTKYVKEYRKIIEELSEEEAKPVYGDLEPEKLRDQNKIDRAHLKLKILLERFVSDEGIKNFRPD